MTIIFPHIPKTGGTTVLRQIKKSGLRIYIDYDCPPGMGPKTRDKCDQRNRDFASRDFSEFDMVFGHFPVMRYMGENYLYVALVRDPYERVVSAYNYLMSRSLEPATRSPNVRARARVLRSGRLSLPEWVERFGSDQIYNLYLARWPRERFQLIGTTNQFAEFSEKLSCLTGVSLDPTIMERKQDSAHFPITASDAAAIRDMLRAEYEWFNAFTESA
jgi:hypothetical protein